MHLPNLRKLKRKHSLQRQFECCHTFLVRVLIFNSPLLSLTIFPVDAAANAFATTGDVDKALLLLHAKSFQAAMDKLVSVFTDIPKEAVRL